ncbi:MAG: hypothetical protein Q7T20_11930 [Saprospiraceae bacterium]|nr:hypothetical protein [Saprospiraceae bacterium]
MNHRFHQYLFEQINRISKAETLLAEEIVELLHQSKANVYKKITGKVPFSTDEVLTIARHYGVSIDQYVHNGHGDYEKIAFDYSLPQHLANTPETFLEKIRHDIEAIARMPQSSIIYASNEIPLFHSLIYPNLLVFKLYVWCRTNWKLPEMLGKKFDAKEMYAQWPKLEEHRKAIADVYQLIPSKEYWSRSVASNILNQIRYYSEGNFFADAAMPQTLRSELLEMLDSRAEMAAQGHKGYLKDGSPTASFDLYLNEIAHTNNIILIRHGENPVAVYTTIDNPNFLRSIDPIFCQRMRQWVRQIEECSFHTSNEWHRLTLFEDLKKKITAE